MAMVSLTLFSFLCLLVILTISQDIPLGIFLSHNCYNGTMYTAKGPSETNLLALLSNLPSKTQNDCGFYNLSYGQNSDKVNATDLCRGDVRPDESSLCLSNSRTLLLKNCPNQKEAIIWHDDCMLRYSNRSIFGIREDSPLFSSSNSHNATEWVQFNQVLTKLLHSLRIAAASGDSRRKFAADNATGPRFQTIYAVAQCKPDLSQLFCNACLANAISVIRPQRCDSRRGCEVFGPSCTIRYDGVRPAKSTKRLLDSL